MVERRKPTAATKETETATQDAAAIIIEYERKRKRRARRKVRRKRRAAERQHHAAMERMLQSIEVIKWCVLAISSVMAISLIVGLLVLNEVENEVERVKAEVQVIRGEAEKIREKIRHPMQTLGGVLGRKFDDQVTNQVSKMLGGDE